ncbi:MAG: integrase arm-type DNA-binding domain-containing protein [Rhodospirillales bacterium]|nr:integrase arm-type DNA-binding domain-containing protein [Rhodospirillales bacterium]
MARCIHKLSDRFVATVDRRGKYGDGGGLWLQVSAFGTKSWIYRFMLHRKAREMGLGSLKGYSLDDAREKAKDCERLVRRGIDPIEARESTDRETAEEEEKNKPFRQWAAAYIVDHKADWANDKHAAQWESTLETYAYPVLGDMSVDEIRTGHVLKCLRPIWSTIPVTAHRLRGRIESILAYAYATNDLKDRSNPAAWEKHLASVLRAPTKIKKTKHHPALHYDSVGPLLVALRLEPSVVGLALEFQLLTGVRASEVTLATWKEIDLDKKMWTIPAERTKSKVEHLVPLSDGAIDILDVVDVRDEIGMADSGDRLVFSQGSRNERISSSNLLKLLDTLGYADITDHGFRATLKTWATECTKYPEEVSEMALGHTIPDKVKRAYQRGKLYEKRSCLMNDWASYCATAESNPGDGPPRIM